MRAKLKQQPRKQSTERKTPLDVRHSDTEEPTELLKRWNASVERLRGRDFATVNQAIEALVNEVLRSNGSPKDREAKELLRLLFESDPHITDTVKRLLVRSGRS